MNNFRIIFLFLVFQTMHSYSQNGFEQNIFNSICKEIEIINKRINIKKGIECIQLFYNDRNLLLIDTVCDLSFEERNLLDSMSIDELFSILILEESPLFPTKKNVVFLDTCGFFSTMYKRISANNSFAIVTETITNYAEDEHTFFYLYAYTFFESQFAISFTSKEDLYGQYLFFNLFFTCDKNMELQFSYSQLFWSKIGKPF